VWLANVLRIVALVLIGTWWSPAVAAGGFHSIAGWLAFNAVALGLVLLTQRTRFFTTAPRPTAGVRRVNPAAAYLVPLLVLVATSMVTDALTGMVDWLYPIRVLTTGIALWLYRRHYAGLLRGWSWPAVGVGGVAFVVWVALEPIPPPGGVAELAEGLAGLPPGLAAAWLCARVVGSVVIVPLAEELAFRGYLTRRLQTDDFESVPLGRFTWFSFLASSTLFGALHGHWLAGTLAGMLYALALYHRGRLADPVLAHAVTNALIAAFVLATGTWAFWL